MYLLHVVSGAYVMPTTQASTLTTLRAELQAARQRASASAPTHDEVRSRMRLRERSPGALKVARGRDDEDEDSARVLKSQRMLEHKAARYEKLAQGLGLADEGLVDWDAKEVDSSSPPPTPPVTSPYDDATDPMVEYVDEWGRTRTARQSEVPRAYLLEKEDGAADEEEAQPIYGAATQFPVYRPTVPQLPTDMASRRTENVHFDVDFDVRARGAAFYRFSHDQETRRAQQASLQALRHETQTQRASAPSSTTASMGMKIGLGAQRRAARQRVIEAHQAQR